MSVNKVILLGNVGQDPKVTYYDGGACVAQVSFATSEKGYTLQNGTQIPDRTEWHNLVFRNLWPRLWTSMYIKATSFMWKEKSAAVRMMTRQASSAM